MKLSILFMSMVASSANALFSREASCCFKLTVSGGADGPVGQLPDGQNRAGNSSLPPGTYCIDNGSITDGNGRGCVLTRECAYVHLVRLHQLTFSSKPLLLNFNVIQAQRLLRDLASIAMELSRTMAEMPHFLLAILAPV